MRSTAEERPGFLRGGDSELNEGDVKEFAWKTRFLFRGLRFD